MAGDDYVVKSAIPRDSGRRQPLNNGRSPRAAKLVIIRWGTEVDLATALLEYGKATAGRVTTAMTLGRPGRPERRAVGMPPGWPVFRPSGWHALAYRS